MKLLFTICYVIYGIISFGLLITYREDLGNLTPMLSVLNGALMLIISAYFKKRSLLTN
ncbi:hypothetical protein [Parageobacillus thermoglucosidasius]|uniref:hypothetical protein n=1 Tax=Parageobacillus thermoglucosidasius TaxID=1426 RepID=UPI000B1E5BB1|nr:hypothetical protein [Parageobacillus thermoglucosidasius]BDG32115.1 hypothetical protein PthBH41_18270 [Parageobacillus thermoglucosidasius]GCD82599.1 hypothetical protein PTHTG4_16610 [Parageobacillus thermoglucosidasius]GMO01017.1 hypothetical protein PthstB1num2_30570 [Parageobacillus thermoglucosidasius]